MRLASKRMRIRHVHMIKKPFKMSALSSGSRADGTDLPLLCLRRVGGSRMLSCFEAFALASDSGMRDCREAKELAWACSDVEDFAEAEPLRRISEAENRLLWRLRHPRGAPVYTNPAMN